MNAAIASRLCTVAMIGAAWTGSALPAPAQLKDEAFVEATRQYQKQRWSAAYGRFIQLANRGDADAARIALFMHQYGPQLFGSYWDASTEEVALWSELSGRPDARPQPLYQPKKY